MNFSAWAINRPIPPILLFMLMCLAGLVCFKQLPIQHLPDTDFPIVKVVASLPGASPSTLENEVTRRLEDSIATIGNVRHITSTINEGNSVSIVQFELEVDSQQAVSDVRNAVETVRNQLPSEMQNPVISRMSTTGSAILGFSVHSDMLSETELSWFTDNEISKQLLTVEGVGEVKRTGGNEREIRIELSPIKLAALDITAADVSNQLKSLLKDAPGGESEIGGMRQSIRTIAAAGNRDDIAAITITLSDGKAVRLDSIAAIKDTFAERNQLALVNGKESVTFEIKRARGASELETAARVRDNIAIIQKKYPHVSIEEIFNTISPVKNNYDAAMNTLFEGSILAIIAVWIFLRDVRATLVASVALPLSILPTFAFIYFLDFQLNSITLLGMTLIIGVLVDDAIVEIENIERHLHHGLTPRNASLVAANEIGLAVVATTFTLVAVFLPTAFMSGMAGVFFKQFGWTASIAVLFSLLVARLITPMMAAQIMRAKPTQKHTQLDSPGKVMSTYLKTVRWSLKNPKTTLVLAFVFLVMSIMLVMQIPTNFVDADDQDQILVSLETQPGSQLSETIIAAEQAGALLEQFDEVENVYIRAGDENGNVTQAKIVATLSPIVDNDRRTQQTLEGILREKVTLIPGARITIGGNNAGQVMEIGLKSDNTYALEKAATEIVGALRAQPGMGNVISSSGLMRPELTIAPYYDRAAELGITTAAISDAIRTATTSEYEQSLPRLNLPDRQLYVRTMIAKNDLTDVDTVRNIKVVGNSGAVPLGSFATMSFEGGPAQIDRLDRTRTITIKIDTMNQPLGEITQLIESIPELKNLPSSVERVSAGDAEQQQELFAGFGMAILAGVLCVYVVLVLLFHDFLQPITILVALPLSAGGAFLALYICGYSLSLSSLIGLIMLMGIVSKNSILLVEFAIMSREEKGLSRTEAIVDACSKRARPIIMTSFAMIAGMLPMALQIGVPSAFRGPMAITVIGGLITSTALSLLVVPCVYVLVDKLKVRLRKLFKTQEQFEPAGHANAS
ncbi:efflux RND transporter permease subunit [Aestuariibacter sp. GS-14]|uniref:efflux RND transporter permease subunit n=1 Tax=Aestuariibacter sp. GS-14 TaxID=2590670 RepID=UPI00112DB13A|nr:efflux RND transporter permease subunit [Aestuariibacter sp. GS-14]TPV59972.1 efflux RND transporter permease subunit [Aestuariibacter sp. GS-14]